MIRNLLAICLFLSVLGSAQTHASTKVFLEDAETSKCIVGASVRLEGVGKPDLVAAFDRKDKCYYFADIPQGYTTIMAYHPCYNEKGFYSKSGLPQEIRLKLYDPLNLSYGFEYKLDSVFVYSRNKYFVTKHYRRLYVEDPYKIAVKVHDEQHCAEIINEIAAVCPELEPVNPYYRDNEKLGQGYDHFSCEELKGFDHNFPLAAGYSLQKSIDYGYKYSQPVVFFRIRDGRKFKRFDDPYLLKLGRVHDLHFFGVVYGKAVYIGKSRYKKKYTSQLDARNSHLNDMDASRIIAYTAALYPVYGNNKYFNAYTFNGDPNGEEVSKSPARDFYLIPYYDCPKVKSSGEMPLDMAPLQVVGLGILDQLEFFYAAHHLTGTSLNDIELSCEYN